MNQSEDTDLRAAAQMKYAPKVPTSRRKKEQPAAAEAGPSAAGGEEFKALIENVGSSFIRQTVCQRLRFWATQHVTGPAWMPCCEAGGLQQTGDGGPPCGQFEASALWLASCADAGPSQLMQAQNDRARREARRGGRGRGRGWAAASAAPAEVAFGGISVVKPGAREGEDSKPFCIC